jgi:hypothetical protein
MSRGYPFPPINTEAWFSRTRRATQLKQPLPHELELTRIVGGF